jgi:hypothetical protein
MTEGDGFYVIEDLYMYAIILLYEPSDVSLGFYLHSHNTYVDYAVS